MSGRITIASFNCHAGIDGWGRPFDVTGACRQLDADVIILTEDWVPDDGQGLAASAASTLGYQVRTQTLTTGARALPDPEASTKWKRPGDWRGFNHSIYLDGERPLPARVLASARFGAAEHGSWGLAILSRDPLSDVDVIDLGRLRQDRSQRRALVGRLEVGGKPLSMVATHMSHIIYGSPLQFRRFRHLLDRTLVPGASVLGGDMNLWGPPVVALLPGWRRAVKGKTWPAWQPHSQVDHLLIRGAVRAESGRVFPTWARTISPYGLSSRLVDRVPGPDDSALF